MIWHDMTWYDMIWHGMTWYDMHWHAEHDEHAGHARHDEHAGHDGHARHDEHVKIALSRLIMGWMIMEGILFIFLIYLFYKLNILIFLWI